MTSNVAEFQTINMETDFKPLTDEQWREYTFPSGAKVKIEAPQKLNVSKSGGHRVLDGAGVSHYVPAGWIHLCWQVKEGHPPFLF